MSCRQPLEYEIDAHQSVTFYGDIVSRMIGKLPRQAVQLLA